MKVYGYCRISTGKQKIERQITNIKREYPDAVIITEEYTGTTTNRPAWNKLIRRVQCGDTIVFDEVSRMSRNAQEGFDLYQDLFKDGVNLVFLKEHHIDTEVYQKALNAHIKKTGNVVVDCVLEGVDNALKELARQQIEIAFNSAQAEKDFLHQRTKEGVEKAREAGKQIGRATGAKIETKKAKEAKKKILTYSKTFGGNLTDKELIEWCGVDRHTYYKYKRDLRDL